MERREFGDSGIMLSIIGFGGIVVKETEAEEARELVREAIDFHIEGLTRDGAPVPPPSSESEFVEVSTA